MAAQRHGLIKSVRLIGWRLTTVAIVAAIALGIIGAVLSAIITASVTSTAITSRLVIFSVITVTLAMIGKYVGQLIYPNFRENTQAKVIGDLNALEKEPVVDEYRAFIEDMSTLLGRAARFRCVIVDDFGVLDRTTRMVLEHYLQHQADERRSELWVIFFLAADNKSSRSKLTVLCETSPTGIAGSGFSGRSHWLNRRDSSLPRHTEFLIGPHSVPSGRSYRTPAGWYIWRIYSGRPTANGAAQLKEEGRRCLRSFLRHCYQREPRPQSMALRTRYTGQLLPGTRTPVQAVACPAARAAFPCRN